MLPAALTAILIGVLLGLAVVGRIAANLWWLDLPADDDDEDDADEDEDNIDLL
jgi:hypothetical protein